MRKRIIRLTESELTNLIHRIVVETKDQHSDMDEMYEIDDMEEGEACQRGQRYRLTPSAI